MIELLFWVEILIIIEMSIWGWRIFEEKRFSTGLDFSIRLAKLWCIELDSDEKPLEKRFFIEFIISEQWLYGQNWDKQTMNDMKQEMMISRNKHHIWTQHEKMIIYGDCVGERVFTLIEIEGSMNCDCTF